jgi:hypothetical protein
MDVEAQIGLPENVKLLNDSASWSGNLVANSSVEVLAEVDLPSDNRYYEISANVKGIDSTRTYSDTATLWIKKSENTFYVSQIRPIENIVTV